MISDQSSDITGGAVFHQQLLNHHCLAILLQIEECFLEVLFVNLHVIEEDLEILRINSPLKQIGKLIDELNSVHGLLLDVLVLSAQRDFHQKVQIKVNGVSGRMLVLQRDFPNGGDDQGVGDFVSLFLG